MNDKEIRQELIASGRARNYMRQRKQYFKENVGMSQTYKDGHIINIEIDKNNKKIVAIGNWSKPADPDYFGMTEQEITICERIRESVKRQLKRMKAHISFMLKQPDYVLFFLTLTFSNDTLDKTSEETRKQTVRRCLSNLAEDFIANIDYGAETEREHYHAVIAVKTEDYETMTKGYDKKIGTFYRWDKLGNTYKYGNYTLQKLRTSKTSITKTSRYINKLANHAYKVNHTSIMTKRNTRYQSYQKYYDANDFEINANIEQANYIESLSQKDQKTVSAISQLFNGDFDIFE